ncbi:DUF4429 domain-containing protein [Streptomyces sp. NPDC005355]|uniref:DUF4429 domain-containing protein n=1 Tax=Streptomyces sp. NPDC005355 TaxID=3157038 RepID=UPI0033B49C25
MVADGFDPPIILQGSTCTVEFDGARCAFRYYTPFQKHSVLKALNGRSIPVTALAGVEVTLPEGGRWGALRILPRPGADPVADVLGSDPPEGLDPYIVRFHRRDRAMAYRLRDALAEAIGATPMGAVPRELLPRAVKRLKGVEGTAELIGRSIRIEWSSGDTPTVIPLGVVEAVEWCAEKELGPYRVRFLVVGEPGRGLEPREDPHTLEVSVVGQAESVLFVATVRAVLDRSWSGLDIRAVAPVRAGETFAAVATRNGVRVGEIGTRLRENRPDSWEISTWELPPHDPMREVETGLLAAAMRRAATEGAGELAVWVLDVPTRRDRLERQGFSLTGEWREQPRDEWLMRAVLRHGPVRRRREVPAVLGDLAPRRVRWRRHIVARGLLPVLGVVFIVAAFVLAGLFAFDRTGLLAAGAFAVMAWTGLRVGYRAERLSRVRNASMALRTDIRRPVLFLRSFQDDAQAAEPSRLGAFTSLEEAVADVVQGVGPFIALDLGRSAPGAARGKVPADEDWRSAILSLLLRCRLVVMRCGTGHALFWELRQVVALLRPEQLIILVPTDPVTYDEFRRRASAVLPHPLPDDAADGPVRQRVAAAITFTYGWHPTVVSFRFGFPRALLALDTRIALRLGPVLKPLGYRRNVHWARRFQVVGLLLITGWLVVRFGLTMQDLSGAVRKSRDLEIPEFP